MMKWFYRGGRPNWLARLLNNGSAAIYALGVAPNYLVTLEVPGRRSGKPIRGDLVFPGLDAALADPLMALANVDLDDFRR